MCFKEFGDINAREELLLRSPSGHIQERESIVPEQFLLKIAAALEREPHVLTDFLLYTMEALSSQSLQLVTVGV